MDIDVAIKAHAGWKLSLRSYANGNAMEYTKAEVAAKDDRCALGRWLLKDGKTAMAGRGMYDELVAEHAEFHRCAGEIVRLIEAGQTAQALDDIDNPGSGFARTSAKMISLLMVLKTTV